MPSQYDYIIVGQGLAGTILAERMRVRNKTCLIIDNYHKESCSKIAAGIINPVTGRRYVKSWMIDELLPKAKEVYQELESFLNIDFLNSYVIVRGLHNYEQENDWSSRCAEPNYRNYVKESTDMNWPVEHLKEPFAKGTIVQGLQVSINKLINSYRAYLLNNNRLKEEEFDYASLKYGDGLVEYKDVIARKIIFAQGWGIRNNPFFQHIPNEPNKGEVVHLKVPGLALDHIIRDKLFVVPMNDYYWIGGAYNRHFVDDAPSPDFLELWIKKLDELFIAPYEISDHLAAVRLASKDRRPIIGSLETHPQIVLFNAFGTKGASLIPYFSDHLIDHLENAKKLNELVDIKRYQ